MNRDEVAQLSHDHPIVFFDGVCGLCSGVVNWLLRQDPAGRFRFTPLQGETARAVLSGAQDNAPAATLSTDSRPLNSIVLMNRGRILRESDAVLAILRELGGGWRALGQFARACPRPVRDHVYRFIARHRYGWFGKLEACRLPTPEERTRFLD